MKKSKKKDELLSQFEKFSALSESEKGFIHGGQVGSNTAPCGYETAGDPNTWISTNNSCEADPEHEDNPCVGSGGNVLG